MKPQRTLKHTFSTFARLVLLGLGAATATAQHWEPAGFGGGGFFGQVAVDPADSRIVYLAADVSGLNKSTNSGDTWFKINAGLDSREVAALAIHPTNSQRLWAGTPLGLYASAQGGAQWSLVSTSVVCYKNVNYRGISLSRSGTILVAGHRLIDPAEPPETGILDGELYRSTDGGSNWTLNTQLNNLFAGAHRRFPAVVFDPRDDNQAFLLVDGVGVLKSTDGGVQWSFFTNGLPSGLSWKNMDVGSNVVYATAAPSLVFRSPRNTASWRLLTNGISGPESVDYAPADTIRVSPANDDSVYLGQAGWPWVLYRSTDGGTNWIGCEVPDRYTFDTTNAPFQNWNDPFQAPICLAIDPSRPQRLFYTTWWGVWRSDDAGTNWVEKIVGAQNTVCTDIESDGQRLVSTHMDVGVYRSLNEGRTWLNCFPEPGQRNIEAHAWSVKRGPGGRIYAGISLPSTPAVCRSDDHGATWLVRTNGLYHPPGFDMGTAVALAVDPSRTGTVYLAVEAFTDRRAIHRSADFGDTWAPLPSAPGSADNANSRRVKCLEVDATSSDRLFAGLFWDGLWYSENGGTNWARAHGLGVDLDYGSVQEIVTLTNGMVVAAFDTGLYRSTDHGHTFTPVLTNANWGEEPALEYVYAVAFNPDNLNEIFISTAKNYPIWYNRGSVWATRNGGSTWLNITANLEVKNVVAMSYHRGCLYAATAGANVYRYDWDVSTPPFRITGIRVAANGQVQIRWPSVTDQQYTLLVSSNLAAGFLALSNHIPAQPPENVYTDTAIGVARRYYRVLIEP